MKELKKIGDLPEAQQKMLYAIIGLRKPAFRTSEMARKVKGDKANGRSVGAVLGSLYRNGYLDKVAGGRDKRWTLSDKVSNSLNDIKEELLRLKAYWG